MNLYLLRHGIAAELGTPGIHRDSDRPLTAEGEKKMAKITRAMKAMELSFDLILSSPYLRAKQTAEIVAHAFHQQDTLEFSDDLVPTGQFGPLLANLNRRHGRTEAVLLVGHEPYLSELITHLVWGNSGGVVVMKKGGLCKLSAASLKDGRCAALEWLLTPKQMALVG